MAQVTNRKIERNAAKLAYKQFCKTWNMEKKAQQKVLAAGGSLPKGQQLLGKKPPFHHWLAVSKKLYEAKRKEALAQKNRIDNLEFVGEEDLSWDEEEAVGQGETQGAAEAPLQVEHLEPKDQDQDQ